MGPSPQIVAQLIEIVDRPHNLDGGPHQIRSRLAESGNFLRRCLGFAEDDLHRAGNLRRRGRLFFDRCSDRGDDFVSGADRFLDPADAANRNARLFLDVANLLQIFEVAFLVCTERFLTSAATTAKPLPASPARAASCVVFNASKLV